MTEGKPRRKRRIWLLFIPLLIILAIAALAKNTPSERMATSDILATRAFEIPPTETPAPPSPTPKSPEEAIRAAVRDVLGKSNRSGVGRINTVQITGTSNRTVLVRWAINDNLSSDYIIRGAQRDICDVASELFGTTYWNVTSLHMIGSFSMKDVYGKVTEDDVVDVMLSKATASKIAWATFDAANIYRVADSADVHPEFR